VQLVGVGSHSCLATVSSPQLGNAGGLLLIDSRIKQKASGCNSSLILHKQAGQHCQTPPNTANTRLARLNCLLLHGKRAPFVDFASSDASSRALELSGQRSKHEGYEASIQRPS
jgi:hypothetical protein